MSDCSKQIEDIIARYGVTKEDIFSSVNDTTNSAVKAGENISGKCGSCGMHTVDLSMEHATGQSKRTRQKKSLTSLRNATCCDSSSRIVCRG